MEIIGNVNYFETLEEHRKNPTYNDNKPYDVYYETYNDFKGLIRIKFNKSDFKVRTFAVFYFADHLKLKHDTYDVLLRETNKYWYTVGSVKYEIIKDDICFSLRILNDVYKDDVFEWTYEIKPNIKNIFL